MTLRWRIAIILAAVAAVVGAVAGTSAWFTTSSQLQSAIDDTLRGTASSLNAQGGPDHSGHDQGQPHPGINCPPTASFQPASAAQIVEPDGVVLKCVAGGVALPASGSDTTLAPLQVRFTSVAIGGDSYRILSTPWREGGTLQIARSLEESDRVLNGLRLELLVLVAVLTGLTAALGWAIATQLARPIMRLRNAAQKIASTLDFTVPIAAGGSGEVRSLTDSFKTMIEAVRQSQDKQRRLVADASHEMRTPLTSLRSNVELLGKIERLPEAERGEVVKEVLDDIDELSSLMGELVDLASDLGTTEEAELVSLSDIARSVATRTQRRSGREVSVEERTGRDVVGRPRQLERAVGNLVDNAIKYSEVGTPVEIVVEAGTVTVCDRGRGIPEADLSRVFDRFYRAVDVRTEPGSGLGLAIVDEIVRSHGGQVFAGNREGGGSAIGFTLPTQATP